MGDAFRVQEAGPNTVLLWWERLNVVLTFQQVRAHGAGFRGELAIDDPGLGVRTYRTQLDLQSGTAHLQLAKARQDMAPRSVDLWRQIVASSCWYMVDRARRGEAAYEFVEPTGPQSVRRWLVDRWIPIGLPTVIYGDGGSGKSMLALALAVCARTGQALGGDPNWRVSPVERVLVLDWESDRDDHQARTKALAAGMGVPFPRGLYHRRMVGPLIDGVDQVIELVRRDQIELVIVDSIAPACGAELEASETAIRFFEAVRAIGGTALCLGHVNKAQAMAPQGRAQVFGSVQFRNQTRSSFEIRAQESDGSAGVALTFRLDKNNLVPPPYPPAIGWSLEWDGQATRFRPAPPDEAMQGFTLRLMDQLRRLGQATVSQLTDALDAKSDTVSKTLRRLEKSDKVEGEPGQAGGKGHERQWWLTDRTRTPNSDKHGHEPDEPPF